MKIFTRTLGAGEQTTISRAGNFVHVIQAKDALQMEFVGANAQTEIIAGIGFGPEDEEGQRLNFEGVIITSATAQTIKVLVGFGLIVDSRVVGMVNLGGAKDASAPATKSVGVAATLIKASNDARRSLMIQPLDGDIYYGTDNTVTIANGVKVASGQSLQIDNTLDVYAIAAAGTVDTRWVEEANV